MQDGKEDFRITLVLSNLVSGGAERVMHILANALAERPGIQVRLAILDDVNYEIRPVTSAVELEQLRIVSAVRNPVWSPRTLAAPFRLRRLLRSGRPAVVLSFIDTANLLVLFALAGSGVPTVVSERTDIAAKSKRLGKLRSALRDLSYLLARRVVVQSARIRSGAPRLWRKKCEVIPNPVPIPRCSARPRDPKRKAAERMEALLQLPPDSDACWILGLGRLNAQKGFDLLIDAFARMALQRPNWRLAIFGAGPEESRLRAQMKAYGLEGRAFLGGRTDSPERVLAAADLFAFPSRYEGFPNALAEAMAAGLPAVAADCPGAVRELIDDGVSGLLVPTEDSAALERALLRLADDADLAAQFGEAARDSMRRFHPRAVTDQWERLLRTAAGRPEGRS